MWHVYITGYPVDFVPSESSKVVQSIDIEIQIKPKMGFDDRDKTNRVFANEMKFTLLSSKTFQKIPTKSSYLQWDLIQQSLYH